MRTAINSIMNRIERLGDHIVGYATTEIKTAYGKNSSFREVVRCIKIGSYGAVMVLLVAAVIL